LNLCDFAKSLHEIPLPNCCAKTCDEAGRNNLHGLTREFIAFNASALSSQQMLMLQTEHERVAEALAIADRFSRTIVHGDLHAENILVNGSGTLTGVIDFDDAWIESKVWEFAGIARGHCFNDEGYLLPNEFYNLYVEARSLLNSHFTLEEFMKLVRVACFRNMLRIFQGDYIEVDQKLRTQRRMNQWLDLRRWMSTWDTLQA
jgi:aminoglycoside phosphotransferase (APT) family kinase protein